MKIITVLAFLTLSSPAYALSLTDAMQELAGMTCSGSTCTSKQSGSVTVDNPDIITTTNVLVSPATRQDAPDTSTQSFGHCPPMATMNGGWQVRTNVNADCTALSLNPGTGGFPEVWRTDTTVTDGGTTTTPTCTTISKELHFHGPTTSKDMAWSITTSESTSSGGC